ncbi:MAG TPA: hypothetical protein VHD33_03090, partial [Legionellaceae bacterium]|nr:hypothetical protein [Legionellaceae bacterium]
KLFIEGHCALEQPQLIISMRQFSLLNACIILNGDIKFIQEMFAYGISVVHKVRFIPEYALSHLTNEHAPISQILILPANTGSQDVTQNSLDFAIEIAASNLDLIKIIAEHTPLDKLINKISDICFETTFGFRLINTNCPIFSISETVNDCNELMNEYKPQNDNISIGCLFYCRDDNKDINEIKLKLSFLPVLIEQFEKKMRSTSSEEVQNTIKTFIARAMVEQKAKKFDQALIAIYAGLITWTRISDYNFDAYQLVLQLLYLRGVVSSKIYPQGNIIAFQTYNVATTLVDYLPTDLSGPLQATKFYKMLCSAKNQCTRNHYQLYQPQMESNTPVLETDSSARPESK